MGGILFSVVNIFRSGTTLKNQQMQHRTRMCCQDHSQADSGGFTFAKSRLDDLIHGKWIDNTETIKNGHVIHAYPHPLQNEEETFRKCITKIGPFGGLDSCPGS